MLEPPARELGAAVVRQWRELKWQRLKPWEKFADMIDRKRDLRGRILQTREQSHFVEGLDSESGSSNDAADGLRDEEPLRFKILTCMVTML
jgi:transposase